MNRRTQLLVGISVTVGVTLLVSWIAVQALIIHQTLLGNYPMIARWKMHGYLLNQSLSFFANEFSGRVATKVMQTSLAVRETVMKLLDVFVYVAVYFVAMIVMARSARYPKALLKPFRRGDRV